MNKEMKLLARKLIALFLSLTLTIGLTPGKIQAEDTKEFSFEILDYADTYYNGFNDDLAVATGTFIELSYGDEANYISVNRAVAKEGDSFTKEITINYSDGAYAEIAYEESDVYLKVMFEGEELYKTKLYTPKYVELSEMPTISLNQEVEVANGVGKYCEQYYRIDSSSLSAANKYKLFTLALDEEIYEDDESDTHIFLYDGTGTQIAENDDSDGGEETVDSLLTFAMPETGERIVGVKGYDNSELTTATLKLVAAAKGIVSFESDNAESLNVFYEGFNDDVLYATGTRIQATLDTGVTNEWQSYGCYWDDEDDEVDGVNFIFGDIQTTLYRGEDGAVYADYGLHYDTSVTGTKKLFTPVIKPVSDISAITEGITTINTLPYDGAYSYYRITAEEDEVWNLHFTYAGEDLEYWELYADIYDADGTLLFTQEQLWDEDTGEIYDLEAEITVPAGTTRIIGLYDNGDESQEFTLTATIKEEEETTSEEVTTGTEETTGEEVTTGTEETTGGEATTGTEETTSEEVTTEEPTSEETTTGTEVTTAVETTTVAPKTTVAPTTKSADEKKIEEFKKAGKAKVKKVTKKKSAKKVKISLKKKLKGVDGYQIRFYKTKKNAKKNKKAVAKIIVKKNKKNFTVKNKKLAKKKTLFIRVRGYIKVKGKTYTGKWSKVKKVKIKK